MNSSRFRPRKKRWGLSYIEVLSSLLVISMLAGLLIGSFSILNHLSESINSYVQLRSYASTLFDTMQLDLNDPAAEEIDCQNYSDSGEISGIRASVQITALDANAEMSFYWVEMDLCKPDTDTHVSCNAILRKGCSSNEI